MKEATQKSKKIFKCYLFEISNSNIKGKRIHGIKKIGKKLKDIPSPH